MSWPASLVLAGAGKMGGAMLRGWLSNGLPPNAVRILDPYLDEAAIAGWRALGVEPTGPDAAPEVFILAVKPQSFAAEAGAFASLAGPDTMVISILAGMTLAALRAGLSGAGAIVRTMPNLPASIGRGATGATAEQGVSAARKATAQTLLAANGLVEWLDETLIDALTAISGSGPAYVFYFTECLAEAGVAAGLAPEVAARLARATVEGAAALMTAEAERSPGALREAVTSPGGTTAAALAVFEKDGAMTALVREAVMAAKARAGALAG